ncbi:uncharacterized protein HLK63_D03685 [Nakaseomyces glabratus]|nr:Oxidoreductase [Nakaseomyces glabratus]UCS19545.1 uncharacterized protein GW608_D03685 [Nakaseomyces glabratus]UCS24778.1 uncharacterized protein HLK63_D03685 [Nakaseomyces glabratus]UCS30008.1 uncharacterized protein HLK64_D03685 [Nakaseomyces glabratus]UCS35236.1 uncharacterized protein HLK62_D03685 [Nakaseomyces glabratus]
MVSAVSRQLVNRQLNRVLLRNARIAPFARATRFYSSKYAQESENAKRHKMGLLIAGVAVAGAIVFVTPPQWKKYFRAAKKVDEVAESKEDPVSEAAEEVSESVQESTEEPQQSQEKENADVGNEQAQDESASSGDSEAKKAHDEFADQNEASEKDSAPMGESADADQTPKDETVAEKTENSKSESSESDQSEQDILSSDLEETMETVSEADKELHQITDNTVLSSEEDKTPKAEELKSTSPSGNDEEPKKEDDSSKTIHSLNSEKDMEAVEEEVKQESAYNPDTGEINWDCPCLGGMAHGPCGEEFKAAFSCFVYSEAEPKGIDCVEKFQHMQDCFRRYPEHYAEQLADPADDENVDHEKNLSEGKDTGVDSTPPKDEADLKTEKEKKIEENASPDEDTASKKD